jgi:uncharacterized membrane protein YfcA
MSTRWFAYAVGVVCVSLFSFCPDFGEKYFLPWYMALAIFTGAFACEFVDSTFGMGFGTILTPLLMLVGFPPTQVVPTILVSELLTGLLTSGSMHVFGIVNLRPGTSGFLAAMTLSICSFFGAVAAVLVAIHIPRKLMALWIAGIVIAMGLLILFKRKPMKYSYPKLLGLGLLASFNKGFSGGGYGPLLTGGQIVAGLAPKEAVAITSFAESFTCFVSLMTYLVTRKPILNPLTLPLVLGAVCSIPLSVHVLRRTQDRRLKRILGVGVILLGLLLILGIN